MSEKALNPFWFTPKHQRKGKPETKFHLRPLDQRAYLALGSEFVKQRRGTKITAEGILDAFEYGVIGWDGHETEYSREAKTAVQTGTPNTHWAIWQKEIAEHLWVNAHLEEPTAKN